MTAVQLIVDGSIALPTGTLPLRSTTLLLAGIAEQRSVRGAAERLDLSYRAAWGRLAALEATLGRPVAVKTKGHGSILTPLGEQVLHALQATLERFAASLASEQQTLAERLDTVMAASRRGLRLAASHDPLLTELLAENPGWDVSVTGSAEAVRRLLAGEADAAGFHLGGEKPGQGAFAALFDDPGFVVHPLFEREQGLMVAAGNPLGLSGLDDLARKRVRFVNRQRGSGTRTWFDRLLAEARLRPAAIRGYEVEEFTHQAVAAVVASGAADAGMGVRVAAARFGLDFLPVGRETYFLAARAGEPQAEILGLVEAARQPARLPGYGPALAESRGGSRH